MTEIPVIVERLDPASPGGEPRKRSHIATEHFSAGTTANEVCVEISQKYGSDVGIWLLQMKVPDPENHQDVEDLSYVTIKDSQHKLEEGNLYYVVHFTGSDVFIFT